MSAALAAMAARRSHAKVGDDAPPRAELIRLMAAAARVADHAHLIPWRLIDIRGDDRALLGAALGRAAGTEASTKPLRAPLLIGVVVSYVSSEKVPRWEQEAVAAGIAHALSLLLDEAGWGVMWRTGPHARHPDVHQALGVEDDEALLGWLYVGSKITDPGPAKARVNVEERLAPPPRRSATLEV